jgi:hypothetical protein
MGKQNKPTLFNVMMQIRRSRDRGDVEIDLDKRGYKRILFSEYKQSLSTSLFSLPMSASSHSLLSLSFSCPHHRQAVFPLALDAREPVVGAAREPALDEHIPRRHSAPARSAATCTVRI